MQDPDVLDVCPIASPLCGASYVRRSVSVAVFAVAVRGELTGLLTTCTLALGSAPQ